MRRTVVIVMGILVLASCVPWLREKHSFSVLVGVITIGLAALIIFGGARAVSAWLKQKSPQEGSAQSGHWAIRFRRHLCGAALVLVLTLTVPHFMVTTSGAYKLAVATSHQSPQFNEALGAPVKEGWFSEGKATLEEPIRSELLISVRGKKREGNLRVVASKEAGQWKLLKLTLELEQPYEIINLLATGGASSGTGH